MLRTSKKRALPSARPMSTAISPRIPSIRNADHDDCQDRHAQRGTARRSGRVHFLVEARGLDRGGPLRATVGARRIVPRDRGRQQPHARGRGAPLRRGAAAGFAWRPRHGAHPRLRRVAAALDSALPAAVDPHPAGAPPGVGRRRPLQPLLSRPPHRPAPSRRGAPAEAPLRSDPLAEARPDQAAVGDMGRRGAGGRPVRAGGQGPPCDGRRHLGHGPARRHALAHAVRNVRSRPALAAAAHAERDRAGPG